LKLSTGLRGIQRLCIETAPFIYFVESHPTYVERMRAIFQALDEGVFVGVTSTVTLTEVLMKPIQANDQALQKAYRELLLNTRHIEVESVSIPIAEKAAALRAAHNLRTPDALQLATAMVSSCQGFLTNDRQLLRVTEISVLVLDDLELDLVTKETP
jgi:predicted nucleic acid-binding protein